LIEILITSQSVPDAGRSRSWCGDSSGGSSRSSESARNIKEIEWTYGMVGLAVVD